MPLRSMAVPSSLAALTGPRALPAPLAALVVVVLSLAVMVGATIGPRAALAQAGEVTIETATNGTDADVGPGPVIEAGQPLSLTWTVTATGTTTLFDLIVSDSSGVTPDCDVNGDGQPDGTSIHPGPLAPGQTYQCFANGTVQDAASGTVQSIGRVGAVDITGATEFTDEDPTHHTPLAPFVPEPAVTISTLVNGHDAGTASGPFITEGSPLTWTYVVTNSGNVPLRDIEVRDEAGEAVDCGGGSSVVTGPLAPGTSVTCSATGTATGPDTGPQSQSGEVQAEALDPATGSTIDQVQADDPATYVPVAPPARLAFTGPTDHIVALGAGLVAMGIGLIILSRTGRRRRPLPIPVTHLDRTG